VLGVEPLHARRELAVSLGAERAVAPEQAEASVTAWTEGVGADIALVTAASPSDAIVNGAIAMLRRRGRVVPVGDVGLGLERAPLYIREADVLISTSYGPGRYDATYEEGGLDYPLAYVRWTENRNMVEFLRLLAAGQVQVEPLIELERSLEQAAEAYAAIAGEAPPLAALLTYGGERGADAGHGQLLARGSRTKTTSHPHAGAVRIALVGAGGFVRAVHVPNIKADASARVTVVVNRSPTSAGDAARLVGGAEAATDWHAAIEREDVDLVVVGTRHDSHAEIAAAALRAGKAVFVEKPLGLSREQIDEVWRAGAGNDRLAIGFNRPFAPLARKLSDDLAQAADGPLHLIYRVCSPLPAEHWLNDPVSGGGRLLGEAPHMFDFANWLCGHPLRVYAAALAPRPAVRTVESASVTIEYAGGSLATVHYSGVGSGEMPKERVEVLRGGRSWVLDDFRSLTSYAAATHTTDTARQPDKGHAELIARVLGAARGERPFEPGLGAAYTAQSVALCALESIASGAAVDVTPPPGGRADG
jgi:predicted dehydrogenase